jgi:peptidoglycan/xylan/chitin deacetylase (PgdA/CDA1 family)
MNQSSPWKPRPWQPSPALKISAATHAALGLGLIAAPAYWPWALGIFGLNHLILTTAGMLPRSSLLGPNLTRLTAGAISRREIALTIDDGPNPEVTPRVLDQLDAGNAKATFFCIGRYARQHPALCREIIARGHQIENHGDSHSSLFATFGMKRMRADILAAQNTLADITGRMPRFFRATAGLRNPMLDPVLASLDLKLASWTRRPFDTRVGNPEIVLKRLTHQLAAGDILLMHDGHAARTPDGEAVILAALPRLLQTFADTRLTAVTLDTASK